MKKIIVLLLVLTVSQAIVAQKSKKETVYEVTDDVYEDIMYRAFTVEVINVDNEKNTFTVVHRMKKDYEFTLNQTASRTVKKGDKFKLKEGEVKIYRKMDHSDFVKYIPKEIKEI